VGRAVLGLREAFAFLEESEELSAGTVLEDEVEFGLVLEGGVDLDEEGVVDFGEDVAFRHDSLALLLLLDVLFLHGLEGVELPVRPLPHQHHLRVRALPDHRQQRVRLQRVRLHP
jgi:hypothetical protein